MVATCVAARRPHEASPGPRVFAVWHATGGLLGGILLGASAATVGWVFEAVLGKGGVKALALALLFVLSLFAVNRLPSGVARYISAPRQVPQSWHRLLPVQLSAGMYGLCLGFGLGTRAPIPFPQILFVVFAAQASPWLAVAGGSVYGFTRAAAVITGALLSATPASLHSMIDSTYKLARGAAFVAAIVSVVILLNPSF
jgi:hypothetical protein